MIFPIIILTLLSCCIFLSLRNNTKITPEVSFYPPKGLSSAEVGLLYYGKATSKELISLIIYLASKGYVKINSCGYSLSFELLKPYDGRKRAEKMIMRALFPDSKRTFVTKEELENSEIFYRRCDEIVIFLNSLKKAIFDKYTVSLFASLVPFFTMILITIFLICVLCCDINNIFKNANYDSVAIYCLFIMCALLKSQQSSIVSMIRKKGEYPKSQIIAAEQIMKKMNILLLIIGIFAFIYLLFSANIGGIFLYLCFIINFICFYKMPEKNKEAAKLLSKILGFKKFIETAEKRKIELLSEKNPNYCSEIVPYAYVFGISTQWGDKIKNVIESKKTLINSDFLNQIGQMAFINKLKI